VIATLHGRLIAWWADRTANRLFMEHGVIAGTMVARQHQREAWRRDQATRMFFWQLVIELLQEIQ
jgi:hypothetical protein